MQYNEALFQKGLQLSNEYFTKDFINKKSISIEFYDRYKKYTYVQRKLYNEYLKPIAQRKNIEQLELEKERFEKTLARNSARFRNHLFQRKINKEIVRENLHPESVAIEFISFDYNQNKNPQDSMLYIGLVTLHTKSEVYSLKLFEEKELQKILTSNNGNQDNLIKNLYASRGIVPIKQKLSKQIYNLVWQPIDSLLQAENIKTVYYSPAGLLHRLNLSALPIDSTQVLGDKYKMVQLSSTRLLALDREETNSENTAYIVGGVDYDYKDSTHPFINNFHEAIYTWLEEQPDSLLQNNGVAYPQSTNDNYFSYVDRSLRGDSWTYLPGTREETQAISSLLNKREYKINYLSENKATEADFKQLGTNSKSPKIIHLATHGFFFPDPVDSLKNNNQEPIFKMSEHPMLRSGLLLAGANRVWNGEASSPDQEDGILTAYEISNMNLTNTELVVLSACETGLGDIQGSEGVYGLQRAFKKAGVRYLIMSL